MIDQGLMEANLGGMVVGRGKRVHPLLRRLHQDCNSIFAAATQGQHQDQPTLETSEVGLPAPLTRLRIAAQNHRDAPDAPETSPMQDPPQPTLSHQMTCERRDNGRDTPTIETCGYHVWANGETVKNNRSSVSPYWMCGYH